MRHLNIWGSRYGRFLVRKLRSPQISGFGSKITGSGKDSMLRLVVAKGLLR